MLHDQALPLSRGDVCQHTGPRGGGSRCCRGGATTERALHGITCFLYQQRGLLFSRGEGGGRGMPAHAHLRQGRELRLIVALRSWPVVW